MKLTEQAKKDFEKWYLNKFHNCNHEDNWASYWLTCFYESTSSKQRDVYVDFFDGV